MLNLQPNEVNKLRQLLASGQITEADLSGIDIRGSLGGQNALAPMFSEQQQFAQGDQSVALPMGSMRNESTGKVTYFKQGGGFSDQPYPASYNQQQPARAKVRVVGYGNGQATDLGEEDMRALPVDYTRGAVEIPGIGKGRYTADGRYAVVDNPDGSRTKVVLGYDAEGSQRLNARDILMRKGEAELAQTQEQTGLLRDKRQMLAAGPPQDSGQPVVSQKALNDIYGKAPEGKRWTADGKLEPIPDGNQKVADAQDVVAILDQAEPLLDKSTGSYGGVAVDQAARVFGTATPGAKAAAQLKALQGTLVSKMPKMSGPQSDKDVALYKEMAGNIGDPTIPADQKRAAMQTIRELNMRYTTGGTLAAPGGAQPGAVSTPAASPRIGEMRKGYVFTGGDPGSQSSWRKVQ